MIRTHLVLSMRRAARHDCELVYFIEIWARGGSRRGASKTFEQVGRGNPYVNQKRKLEGDAEPPGAPRLASAILPFLSSGLEPRAVAENECTVARPRPPPIRSDSKVKHETPLTPEYARGKETRTVPRARHRTEVAQRYERPQSRQSTRPDAWQAAHTQLSNNHSSKTCLARAHMHTLRQVRFLAQRIAAPVPVGAELARLQYFERHLYAFLFVRKLSPYGDEL